MNFQEFLIIKNICSIIKENIDDVDADKIAKYIQLKEPTVNASNLGNLFAGISKRLTKDDRITSHFLSDLYNSISSGVGKKNRFQSTREIVPHDWHGNPEDRNSKRYRVLQQAKEYAKNDNDKESVRDKLMRSIDPNSTKPGVIKKAVDWAVDQVFSPKKLNINNIKQNLQQYKQVELDKNDINLAKSKYEQLKNQYGEHAAHRIEELAQESLDALNELPEGAKESRLSHQKNLAVIAWMLDRLTKEGVTGRIEDPTLQNLEANLDKIREGERYKGIPWANMLTHAVIQVSGLENSNKLTKDFYSQIFFNIKSGKFSDEVLDQALKILRQDYGSLTVNQLKEILPTLQNVNSTIKPANTPMRRAALSPNKDVSQRI